MNIKKLFSLAIVIGCIAHETYAMKKEYEELSYTISNIVELDEFWQKVKTGEIPHDKAQYTLRKTTEYLDYNDQKLGNLLKQAVYAGLAPSTLVWFASKESIIEYALRKKNASLVQCCFEQGYSPNSIIVYCGKKTPILAVAPFFMWPLFKKYGAHFNMTIKNEDNGTLLHKSVNSTNPEETLWLLQEINIDINQPDGNGNTAGHELATMFYLGNKKSNKSKKKIFIALIENNIDPFQKNNDNETPKDIAQRIVEYYEKKLLTDLYPYQISLCDEYLSNAIKMVSYWEQYEREYTRNSCYKNIIKHCYCGDFPYFNKNDKYIQSQNLPLEQIHNAYNFFPLDSIIGSFCKKNPNDDHCVAIAKLYATFNAVHHIIEKRNNISSQLALLRQKRTAIIERLKIASDQRTELSHEEMLEVVDPALQAQFKIKDQLQSKKRCALHMAIGHALDEKLGMTDLWAQRDSIDQQSKQLNIDYTTVSQQENKQRKGIYGYYSALDFNMCSGTTTYHHAVKNLLETVPSYELKMIEAEKINQGLHNAYHNKKQS